MNIAVFVSGSGTNLQAIIDKIDDGYLTNTKIALVISSRDDVYAIERAKTNNIPCSVIKRKNYKTLQEYDKSLLNELSNKSIDLIVLAGFLSFLGPDLINEYKNKIINVHPSLIPSFCGEGMYGIKPHKAALARGVKITGATVHFVNEHYDCGPIILQKAVQIEDTDTPEVLQKRVMKECEHIILPQAIKLFLENKIEIVGNKTFIN